jgi:hypothetical protein
MNKSIFAVVAIVALTGLGGYALSNHAGAQGAPLTQVSNDTQTRTITPGWRRGDDGRWGRHRWMMVGGRRPWQTAQARNWGLFSPQSDKNLSVTDVQTLAQAILLRHGNHTWKVVNVATNQDDTVSFAFATQDGGVIARFAMDTHTGRLRRLG